MNKLVLLTPLAALIAATPAFAQDTAANLTGPRIELRTGWDHVDLDAAYDDGTGVEAGEGGESGISFGGEVGYDAQVGGVLLGAYAGVDFTTADHCEAVFGNDEACLEVGRNIQLGVRAGVPIGQNAAAYVRGGYSNGRLAFTYTDGSDELEIGQNLDGFHLGAGFEVGLGGNLYASGQYLYTNYGGVDYADPDLEYAIDTDRHQVLVGLGIRL